VKRYFVSLVVALQIWSFSNSAFCQTVPLDLDAQNGFNAVALTLDAGLYNVSLRDGVFRAWSAWSETSPDCTNNCAQGWMNFYGVFNHESGQGFYVENGIGTPLDQYDFNSRVGYSTPGAALAAGVLPFAFDLSVPSTVEFAIPDCDGCFGDNRGGLSLTVSRVFGTGPSNPVFPTIIEDDGSFIFNDVPGGQWFDPPLASGYRYETTDGARFTEVGMPPIENVPDLDGQFTLVSPLGSQVLASGANLTFATPVEWFVVQGISPLVDGGDPLAFPTYLAFDAPTASFKMTPIPEPSSLALLLIGVVVPLLRRCLYRGEVGRRASSQMQRVGMSAPGRAGRW
jgi:hypothetical protein